MSDETKIARSLAFAAITRKAVLRPYRKPALVMRERLSKITAEDGKASGITVN